MESVRRKANFRRREENLHFDSEVGYALQR
jgi:hypothetical protein